MYFVWGLKKNKLLTVVRKVTGDRQVRRDNLEVAYKWH